MVIRKIQDSIKNRDQTNKGFKDMEKIHYVVKEEEEYETAVISVKLKPSDKQKFLSIIGYGNASAFCRDAILKFIEGHERNTKK